MNLSAIYCRVSTDDQESHGSSLPYQVETCLKYAEENELKIGKKVNGENAIFLESFSGGYYERPLLLELLSLVKSGSISCVIFTKRDRVARDQYVFQRIKKEIEEAGGKMIFAEEKLTGDTAIDSFMGSTIVGFAEWEREQIKRRTHAGKIQHARENKWGFGFIPYGYTKNPATKQLEIFDDEARIVRLIYRLYLEEGYTLDGIARYLDNEKIPPPSLSTKGTNNQKSIANSRKNTSGKWIASTIYRIFERGELYSGTYTAFRDIHKTVAGKTKIIGQRPKEEWVIISLPPLVSLADAEEVLEKLEQNKRFSKKRSVRSYLLRGKLLCDCENPYHHMVGYPGQKVKKGTDGKVLLDSEGNKIKDYYTNYRCSLFSIGKTEESRRCSNHISGIKIESLVMNTIKELFLAPESMFEYAIEREQGTEGKVGENAGEEQIEGDYTELVEKLRNLMKKHERIEELFVDGTISKDRMREMKEHVGNEQERLSKILEKEEKILRQEEFSSTARESWETIRKELGGQIGQFFLEATEEEKRSLIELLVERVILTHGDKKHVIIRFKIPLDIHLEGKYIEDKELFADDEYGRKTSIGTYSFPTIFPVGEIHAPIVSKEVEFGEPEREKEEENKKKDKNNKGGKGGGTGGKNISSAIGKVLGFLKKKYTLSCRGDHEKSKTHSKRMGFLFIDFTGFFYSILLLYKSKLTMEFAIIGILTLLNGFFALSEIALVSVKKSKMQHLASKGNKRAKIVLNLLENPENFLSSVQVGITLIGVISGAYGGAAVARVLTQYIELIPLIGGHAESIALAVAIAGITYFSIVIGELVPKTIAMNNPEGLALFCVPILRYFMFITYPFVKLLSFSTMVILKTLGIKDVGEEKLSEEELISLLKSAGRQGVLDKEESTIHHNVFSFGDQTAKSMITHRNLVEWVDIQDSKEEIFKKIQDSIHSKFVVADGTLDNVVGILKIREFLESQNLAEFDLKKIITKAIVVTENTSAIQILNTFKRKKEYIAIVVDEFGGTEGIITLHDLMEVIVGNLPDEDEETEGNIVKGSGGQYIINGRTLVYEINQFFQEDVIEDKSTEYTTLSGYIMHVFERLPKTGEKFQSENGYEFEVVDMDGVRIDKVIMKKIIESSQNTI